MKPLLCPNPKCKSDLSGFVPDIVAGAHICKCPACELEQNIHIFPAYFRTQKKGAIPEKIIIDSDACCFNHPDKVASHICDTCGIYICDLCNLELVEGHFCPKCFKTAKDKNTTFMAKAVLYDEIFMMLSILFMLTCYLGVIASPFLIGACIYFWNKMKTPYRRRKWRFTLAITICGLEIILITGLIVALVIWRK